MNQIIFTEQLKFCWVSGVLLFQILLMDSVQRNDQFDDLHNTDDKCKPFQRLVMNWHWFAEDQIVIDCARSVHRFGYLMFRFAATHDY